MSAVDRSFPYYHDCPQSDNYQRYGLLDPITNRFIILSKSYASIKYTQILLSQIQMTSLIPIDIIINPLKFIKNRLNYTCYYEFRYYGFYLAMIMQRNTSNCFYY